MEFIIFFAAELLLFYFLSRRLMTLLHSHIRKGIRSKMLAVYFISILFFPGTLFHELAHYVSAILLGVPTGTIRLFPEISGNTATLGSVEIAKTDPIRRFLVGVAPLFTGIAAITLLIHFGKDSQFASPPLREIILGFFIFEIANSMFASDKDMEGSLALLLTVGVLLSAFFIIAIRYSISITLPTQVIAFSQTIAFYLLFPVAINAFFVVMFLLFSKKRPLSL